MNSLQTTDTILIERLIEREEAALSELYSSYGARVYGIAFQLLKNAALAEEVTQDTFLKVWDYAERWNENRGKLSTWISTIARFTAIDLLRREHQHFSDPGLILEEMFPPKSEGSFTQREDANALKTLLAQLPAEQVEAIELAFFMGMTHQEIAEYLCEPLGTIKSRIRNGLQTLRRLWVVEMA